MPCAARRLARFLSSTGPLLRVPWLVLAATSGPPAREIHLLSQDLHKRALRESWSTSPEKTQHLFMHQPVCAEEAPFVDGTLAVYRGCPAACLFHDDAERREIPRLRNPIQRAFNRTFRHQHVLPKAADRTAAARCIRKSPHARPGVGILPGPCAGGENHGLRQPRNLGHTQLPLASPSPFPPIGPPTSTHSQCRCTDHARDDFRVFLNAD